MSCQYCQQTNAANCPYCSPQQGLGGQQTMANQSALNPTACYTLPHQMTTAQAMQGYLRSLDFDEDYNMFKKYAHLTDVELLNTYVESLTNAKKKHEADLLRLQQEYEEESLEVLAPSVI